MRTIYRERLHRADPRLGRHVLHDSESRRFVFDTSSLTIQSVEHRRVLPILNQLRVGKCTAEAALSVLGTEPYWSPSLMDRFANAFGSADDKGTDGLYSAEQNIDGDGPYPPNDNGSSGLTSAKACRAAGLISGWTQVFSLDAFLRALTRYPISCGTVWYQSMFHPDTSGVLTVDTKSGIAGGHQYECVGYNVGTDRLKFANSWGTGWGDRGYFYMPVATFGALLAKQGDATIFTPITQPAPVPTPAPVVPSAADIALNAAVGDWPDAHHIGRTAVVAHVLQTWRIAEGLE